VPAIRPVHFQNLIRVFEQDGFRFDRQEGDHRIYVKAGANPMKEKTLPATVCRPRPGAAYVSWQGTAALEHY
jgi:predicted RNA binding protein YcfA (HicA-like mRNA interferase family)